MATPEQILSVVLISLVISFFVLIFLIFFNLKQVRKLYSLRAEDKIWDPWGSLSFGLSIFLIGFSGLLLGMFFYLSSTHPEILGLGFSPLTYFQNPIPSLMLLIYIIIGMGVSIFGVSLSIYGMDRFINNVEKIRGEKK